MSGFDQEDSSSQVARIGSIVGVYLAGTSLFAMLILLFIGTDTLEKGQIGVYSYRPMIFGSNGLGEEVLVGPGRFYMFPTTKLEKAPLVPFSLVVHAEDFMAKDRVPLDFDVSMTLQLVDTSQTPSMFRKFGGGPEETFRTFVLQKDAKGASAGEFMSYLRDQIRHYHSSVFVNAQTENGDVSDDAKKVEESTTSHINKFLATQGAGMIKVTNIALGRANPPPGVRSAIERTAEQAQEQKTQVERQRAAVSRLNAEVATAEADMAYVRAMGLDGNQFVELSRIRMLEKVCGNEKSPRPCILSATGSTPVAVSVPPPVQRASTEQPSTVAVKK